MIPSTPEGAALSQEGLLSVRSKREGREGDGAAVGRMAEQSCRGEEFREQGLAVGKGARGAGEKR